MIDKLFNNHILAADNAEKDAPCSLMARKSSMPLQHSRSSFTTKTGTELLRVIDTHDQDLKNEAVQAACGEYCEKKRCVLVEDDSVLKGSEV